MGCLGCHQAAAPEPQAQPGRLGQAGRGPGAGGCRGATTNYLACLLRSVTLTLPRTRLRYNLGKDSSLQPQAHCSHPHPRPHRDLLPTPKSAITHPIQAPLV